MTDKQLLQLLATVWTVTLTILTAGIYLIIRLFRRS